jgi:DNA-directed RNA polymerase subunit RPC12/RpoP
MTDIFDNKIFCKDCDRQMGQTKVEKNGFLLRAVICPRCSSKIIHPKDEQEYENFKNLKKKQFSVKMRFIGNSYAISIPKEIANFINEQEKAMNNMVRLCMEDFGKVSLDFGNGIRNRRFN